MSKYVEICGFIYCGNHLIPFVVFLFFPKLQTCTVKTGPLPGRLVDSLGVVW